METKKLRHVGGLLISFFMFAIGIIGIINSLETGDNSKLIKSIFGTVIFLIFIIIGLINRHRMAGNSAS